jgi:hypothetical protein
MNVNTTEAHPVVYGREEDDFRPRLPPEHRELVDERENGVTYMEKTAGAIYFTSI